MKYLIVNADDFGAGRDINRGIVEAHVRGILTSTSLMVDMPGATEAARQSADLPELSIGLHVQLTREEGSLLIDPSDSAACRTELRRQLSEFHELMGRLPTHLDSHHNIHRNPQLLPHFREIAQELVMPLREHSAARYFSKFYGQWDGESHFEQISVDNLSYMLAVEVGDGITELSCHPGYMSPDFHSAYSVEREAELRTLCDHRIREKLNELCIQLIGFIDLKNLSNRNGRSASARAAAVATRSAM